MKRVLAIVGPTAAGKTETAVYLGQNLKGEIINADSRQVYRYMDIGTDKPSREQQAAVKHHLIDIIEPDDEFSLALYKEMVDETIKDIHNRGKLPIIVGGSGQYVWAVLEGWTIPQIKSNRLLRNQLEQKALAYGHDFLYDELLKVDPRTAVNIDKNNTRRIIRALEVFAITGTPFSAVKQKITPDFHYAVLGLTMKRGDLYAKIDSRVDEMISRGLIEETNTLLRLGYATDLPSMSGIGYHEISLLLNGALDLSTTVETIKKVTHRLVRRQYTWFKLSDPRIHWVDITITPKKKILEWCLNNLGELQAGSASN